MNVELNPDLELRLRDAASRGSQSVPQLVEDVLTRYLDTLADDATTTVRATMDLLPRVWPPEDFSDWRPPTGR